MLCCDGNPSEMARNSGRIFSSYYLLTSLGFGFFHPLRPNVPKSLQISQKFVPGEILSPFWPIRGAHYHSEHPLDLAEFLFGIDSVDKVRKRGENFANFCRKFFFFKKNNFVFFKTWDEMVPEWQQYLGWLAAHKVNRLEFVLLCPSDDLNLCQNANKTQRYR